MLVMPSSTVSDCIGHSIRMSWVDVIIVLD